MSLASRLLRAYDALVGPDPAATPPPVTEEPYTSTPMIPDWRDDLTPEHERREMQATAEALHEDIYRLRLEVKSILRERGIHV